MSDSDKSIQRKDPSAYEKIAVNPLEKDKREKEEGYTSLKGSTRSQIFATLTSYFKKILTILSTKEKKVFVDQQQLLTHVLAFRKLLVILSKEDKSHDPEFTQQLSELWHNLLDDCNLPSQIPSETLDKIKFYISQVQNYPSSADHTLGYYFTQYAGKDWLPFPFMELLQQLHEEHIATPQTSVLTNWLTLLNDIITSSGTSLD